MYEKTALEYDDLSHTYKVNGLTIPSVTQVLKSEGYVSSFCVDDEAAHFGNAVHKMVELDIKGQLDRSTISEGLSNPLAGWHAFRRDFSGLEPIVDLVEKPMYHHVLLYGGTPDIPAVLKHRSGKAETVYIDLKAGVKQEYWALQTAAYAPLICQELGVLTGSALKDSKAISQVKRWSLSLSPWKKSYELVEYTDKTDPTVFYAALTQYRWKRAHGIKESS